MRFLSIFLLAIPTISQADCPQITIDGPETAAVKLPSTQANCTATDVFTCARGTLRTNGRVDSITNGSVQLSAFCHLEKGDLSPAEAQTESESPPNFAERFSGDDEQ
jgi:hypothetical protein